MVAEIVSLALEYYRNPLGYRQLTDSSRPICKPCEELVGALGTALGSTNVRAAAARLGTTPEYLEEAARFFVRQVLLAPGSDHYRVLGLPPGAAEEKIRRHYHFLAGMFHPDRSPSDLERSTSVMARINEAYNALRTPEGRQAYSRRLGEVVRADSIVDAPAVAPSHTYSPSPSGFTKPPESPLRRRGPFAITAWVTLALLGTLVAAVVLDSINAPRLRVRGEPTGLPFSGPSFLQGDQPAKADAPNIEATEGPPALSIPSSADAQEDLQAGVLSTVQNSANADTPSPNGLPAPENTDSPPYAGEATAVASSPAPTPRYGGPAHFASPERTGRALNSARDFLRTESESANRAYRRRASPPPPVAPTTSPRPRRHQPPPRKNPPKSRVATPDPTPKAAPPSADPTRANGIVFRLSSCYKKGNLGCLAGLFTADAQVNDGSGIAFIRSDYGDFFKRTSQRRLSVRKVHWRAMDKGRIEGTGTFTASTKDDGTSNWRHGSGTIRFELLKVRGSYKISQMIYSYGP